MRKDGKSQYQLKKEKLQLVKCIIDANNQRWKRIQNKTNTQEDLDNLQTASELIKIIWEIVKNEK